MSHPEAKQAAPAVDDGETRRWVLACRRLLVRAIGNVNRILRVFYLACGVFVLLDLVFLFGWADKHAHFAFENVTGYYAAYGFVACVLLIFVSKHVLRPAVIRREDYYDKPGNDRD